MLAVALAALAAVPALAAAATPEWGLAIAHEPREVGREHATAQVWAVTVEEGNVGKLRLKAARNGQNAETPALPMNASAAQVEKALESIGFIGPNVEVTKQLIKAGEWTYTVKFVRALEGINVEVEATAEISSSAVEELEAKEIEVVEAFAEAEETQEGERNTVEYAVTATNLGAGPTSGTITITDKLPAGLITEATPEAPAFVCTPAFEGQTETKCTSSTPVAAGAKVTLRIYAYADPAKLTEGERLTDTANVSGGGLAPASGEDVATVGGLKPLAVTSAAATIGATAATLQGTVDPEGVAVGKCYFEYGTTTAYGQSVPCANAPGSAAFAVPVTAVASLLAHTTYHARLVAFNATETGMRSYGNDVTFTTPAAPAPSLSAPAASAVTQTSATLGGSINPNGAPIIECRFEYGTSAAYGASAPCTALPAAGASPAAVSAALTFLSANTGYHFRLVAGNEGGTSHGEDQTFQTPPAPPVPGGASSRIAPIPDAELVGLLFTATPTGLLPVKVSCPAPETICTGTISMKSAAAVAARAPRAAVLALASASFKVAGGRTALVTLHLSARARAWLARVHSARAKATIAGHDPAGATHIAVQTVTIKLSKARKH